MRRRVREALRDRRRLTYLGVGNPILTLGVAVGALAAGRPETSLIAGALGGVKDGALLFSIRKEVEKYLAEKRALADRLAQIEARLEFLEEDDNEEYQSIKSDIIGFFEA